MRQLHSRHEPKEVLAKDIPDGKCFRKKQGEHIYVRIDANAVLDLCLSQDSVWGVSLQSGNHTKVPKDQTVIREYVSYLKKKDTEINHVPLGKIKEGECFSDWGCKTIYIKLSYFSVHSMKLDTQRVFGISLKNGSYRNMSPIYTNVQPVTIAYRRNNIVQPKPKISLAVDLADPDKRIPHYIDAKDLSIAEAEKLVNKINSQYRGDNKYYSTTVVSENSKKMNAVDHPPFKRSAMKFIKVGQAYELLHHNDKVDPIAVFRVDPIVVFRNELLPLQHIRWINFNPAGHYHVHNSVLGAQETIVRGIKGIGPVMMDYQYFLHAKTDNIQLSHWTCTPLTNQLIVPRFINEIREHNHA